ncbi:3-deoxy-manno-octulosonate cytidylyltransferase [bacterium]|nr:3-deoxy-manno-octulosonate cytidylyltransferase [bacterium]
MGKTAIIIPARYGSSRLEGKPLIEVNGKPIIQWVWERAKSVKSADEVIIATDDRRIYDCAKSFNAEVEMTSTEHKCGSDRICEVAKRHSDFDIIVNLQGDEPMINPECVETVIQLLKNDSNADISTLVAEAEKDEIDNPNNVKCVFDKNGYALYFSRSKIPFERKTDIAVFYKHIGIYGYRRKALFDMAQLPQAMIEKTESLEQLRALYFGMKIKTAVVNYKAVGIDTKEDLEKFKELVKG